MMLQNTRERARAILALAGELDAETLAALAPGAPILLATDPDVRQSEGRFTLDPTRREQLRDTLVREAPRHYRTLLEEIVAALVVGIEQGRPGLELAFATGYETLASLLFADDTPAFLRLIERVADLPLTTAPARQRRAYFAAVAEFKQDRYDAARQALDALLADPTLELYVKARATNARAVVYRLSGQPEEALEGYTASLALWRELENAHYEAMVLMNMGILAYELREYQLAEERLRQAEELFQAAGAASAGWLAAVHNELGLLYRDLGRWEKALAYLQRFRAARREAGASEDVALALLNIGEILLFQGEIREARTQLEKARTQMETRAYQVDLLLHLGLVVEAEGESALARRYFAEALRLAQAIGRVDILPHAYYHVGMAAARAGEPEQARRLLIQAAELIEETRQPLETEQIKISLLGRWQQVYEALILHYVEQGDVAEAFVWVERARARALADMVGAEAMDEVVTAEAVQGELPSDTAVVAYFTTGVLAGDQPLLRQIPKHHPLRQVLLLPPRIFFFVLSAKGIACYRAPLDPNLLYSQALPASLHKRLLRPRVRERLQTTLVRVAPEVSEAEHLILIPHGPLHHVPFAALLPEKELSLAPSATFLLQQGSPSPSSRQGLAVGYDGERLAHTEAEVRLAARLAGGEAWAGPETKKERLQQSVRGRRWLHFACHGWFDEANPMASYLETGTGERLTAEEILANWELSAELVVLSACQTGVSAILRGDEPMGLVRAFLFAGAQSLLVSQWPVNDLATYLLMGRFYRLLGEGDGRCRALQQAQAWLRQLTRAELSSLLETMPYAPGSFVSDSERPFAHPEHWAAFVLIKGLDERTS